MSLATKYRPKTFEDMVGQDIAKRILIKEVETNNIKHSYIFEGTTGAGKTTASRILANVVNGVTIEFDVASHNSVDDIKELINSVRTKPIGYDKVVVILDEVHTIFGRKDSLAAQALLKILEEPPKHLIFIMCTTEGDKIIDTIRNRCECIPFTNVDIDSIVARLDFICKQETIQYDNIMALTEIAKRADGSMRNAISILEQITSLGALTVANVTNTISSKYDNMFKVMYATFDKDITTIINVVDSVQDIDKFVNSYFTFILDICIYAKTNNIKLTKLPSVFTDNLSFSDSEKKILNTIMNDLLQLQYEGRNNPILKQLFIAVAMQEIK